MRSRANRAERPCSGSRGAPTLRGPGKDGLVEAKAMLSLVPQPISEPAVEPPPRGRRSMPSFKPYGLAGTRGEYAAVAILTVAVILVFAADMAITAPIEIVALGLIPLLAAAWLLSTRFALWVAVLSIGLIAAEGVTGGLAPITSAAEAVVFAILALSTRLYASRLRIVLEGTDREPAALAATVFGLENLAHLVDASPYGVAAVDQKGRVRYANAAARDLLDLQPDLPSRDEGAASVVGAEPLSMLSELASAEPSGGSHSHFSFPDRTGQTRCLEIDQTPFMARGHRMTGLAIWDLSEIKRLEHAASVLAETAANMAVTQPLEVTLQAVARQVVEVSQASACGVFLIEGERTLHLIGSWGLPDGYAAAALAASRQGGNLPALEAMRTGAPVFVENLPGRIQTEQQFVTMRSVAKDVSWRLAIAFPMIHNGRALGALAVYFPAGQRPNEPTLNFLSAIAGQVASAAQVSRLVAAEQGRIAEDERHRLSRELHDSLSQELYGIVLGAKSAKRSLGREAEDLGEVLDYILELAEAGLADMRNLVRELRPESLEKEGMIAGLRQCAAAITRRYGLNVTTRLPDEPLLPLELKLVAYRIAQEALHNVVRHGHARHAWLQVAVEKNVIAIDILDDGEGFDPAASFPGHFGLESMRERVAALGGELQVESGPGRGTAVRARIPVAHRAPVDKTAAAGMHGGEW